jgi:hypothetical protein
MMKTMMIAFVIAMTACGVEQLDNPDRREEVVQQPDQSGAEPGSDAPAPCTLTTDCAIGVCDLVTRTCVGDDSWRADIDAQRRDGR